MNVRAMAGLLTALAALVGGAATLISSLKGDVTKQAPPSSATSYNLGVNNGAIFRDVGGNAHIEIRNEIARQPASLDVVDIHLPRNNEKVAGNDDIFSLKEMDNRIIGIFDDLISRDGKIVFIRFDTYVGAGFGIDDVPSTQPARAGVIYDLSKLDGFGGDVSSYEYGYTVSLGQYRDKWRRSREATLLFPKQGGNAFFEVHYMKSMNFEGIAKIKVSGVQGNIFVEILPVTPTDDLLLAYGEIKKKIGQMKIQEF